VQAVETDLNEGVMGQPGLSTAIVMTLVTTLATPLLLRAALARRTTAAVMPARGAHPESLVLDQLERIEV